MITTIGFDGDDTLWHTESVYSSTEAEFQRILSTYLPAEDLKERLFATEMQNLHLFGYGVKGFILSMIETALQISDFRLDGRDMQRILDIGKAMLDRKLEPIEGAADALRRLAPGYQLLLITKGDLFDQENKLEQSGLRDLFAGVEIVSDKEPATYRRVLGRYSVEPERFLMVGNSLRSDVRPVVEMGGRAIHVPYHVTWAHEEDAADDLPVDRYRRVAEIAGVPDAIARLERGEALTS